MKTHLFSFVVAVLLSTSLSFANRVYIIGDATPGGWSLDSALLMEPTSNGIFEWVGDLKNGSLKFITHHDWIPSYGPQVNNDSLSFGNVNLTLRTSYEDPDNAFTVAAGRYFLTLNLSGDIPQLIIANGKDIENKGISNYHPEILYAIGSATTANWTLSNAIAVPETSCNSGIYRSNITLCSGELKFLNQKDWGNGYGATNTGSLVQGSGEYALAKLDENDRKYTIDLLDSVEYSMEINIITGILSLKANGEEPITYPNTLYMIGPALGGWDWTTNCQEMTNTGEGIFTWTGTLLEGELKFFIEKDFSATAYGAISAGTIMEANGEYDIIKLSVNDNKFIAPSATVTLNVDLKQMKLTSIQETSTAFDHIEAEEKIMVYDLMGMLHICTNTNNLYLNTLQPGIYIINNGTQTKKVIIK